MKTIIAAAALGIAAGARADWIDRVQPACAERRVYAARQLEQVKLHEEVARVEKDPAERKRLEATAAKLRGPAGAQQRKYEKCRKTAPKVMSEEQARREERQAQEEDFQRMIERQRHPPGAIAPLPKERPGQ